MSPVPTVRRLRSWPHVRAVEGLVGLATRVSPGLGALGVGGIIDAARRRVGLSELGEDGFLEPMDRLLGEADRAPLTPLARLILRQGATTAVANRLRIRAYVERHPEVRKIRIERPVFVVGFPRSGTTLLQDLLSLPEECRALRFWELISPVPAAEAAAVDRRRRRATAAAVVAAAYFVAPEQRVIHRVGVDTAEECWLLFQNRFSALNNDLASGFTGFGDWLLGQDLLPAYEEYRLQLQVLSHRTGPRRLVLKCPEHLWFLDPLLTVFPDASVVWTHRDPVDSVVSYCSLSSLQIRNMWGCVDGPRLGAHISRRFVEGVTRAAEARDRHPGANVVDVGFEALSQDTLGVVRGVHEAIGLPWDAAAADRARRRVAAGRVEARWRHVYVPEPWGIDLPALRPRFDAYVQRFAVPTGASRPTLIG